MRPVGIPMRPSREHVQELFMSLKELYDSNWHHGDARWQNAIKHDNKVYWVDFLDAKKGDPLHPYYRAFDTSALAESLLSSHQIPLSSEATLDGIWDTFLAAAGLAETEIDSGNTEDAEVTEALNSAATTVYTNLAASVASELAPVKT